MKFVAALITAAMIVGSSAQSSGSTCLVNCPATYEPVCGDNGVTYLNDCERANANCLLTNGDYIFNKTQGLCPMDGSGSTCLSDCQPLDKPVCGDNGITYNNGCELANVNCLLANGDYIFTKSQGPCPQ